jgi:hypothetical protein
MKKLLAFVVVALLAPAVFADDALVKELERTEAKLLKTLEGVTPAQWTYKSGPDRWSIAECVEHITAAEPFIRELIVKSLETPAAENAKKDEMVLAMLVDRSKKFKAPEPLIPTNKYADLAAGIAAFKAERAKTIELAKNGGDFRAHGSEHFAFGPLDSYGWVLFLSGHSERHTLQIEEVMKTDGYPKS